MSSDNQSRVKDGELAFNIASRIVYTSQEIPVDKRCTSWTARNIGDTAVRVNQVRLLPFPPGFPDLSGESMAVPGNRGEIYVGKIQIQFEALPGLTPAVEITQKFYIP